MSCYRSWLSMKTITKTYLILLSHLTGGLCGSSCNGRGEEGQIQKESGGKVTLRVTATEEIHEVHWIRQETHNVFFRMVDCCSSQNACCRSETPRDCCRIENKTYERKLCSCQVSALTSSITMCNVSSEDEGVFIADIQHKQSNVSNMCKFYLSVRGNNEDQKDKAGHNVSKTVIISTVVTFTMAIIIGAVLYKRRECRIMLSSNSYLATSDTSVPLSRPNTEPRAIPEPSSSGLELVPMEVEHYATQQPTTQTSQEMEITFL